MTTPEMSFIERLRSWWRSWWHRPSPPPPQPSQTPQVSQSPETVHKTVDAEQDRYEVSDVSGQLSGDFDRLADAHQHWQEATDSQGTIIDRYTGEDVTPQSDDNGRYVVIDSDGTQAGSYDTLTEAERAWEGRTSRQGRIVDTQAGKDVTPRVSQRTTLSDQQLWQLRSRLAGKLFRRRNPLYVDMDLVAQLAQPISRLPIPVFERTNFEGLGLTQPKKTVPIKRREVEIETVRKKVWIEEKGLPRTSGRAFTRTPTDEPEPVVLQDLRDVAKAHLRDLAMPRPHLARQITNRQLLVPGYVDEVPGKPAVQRRLVWRDEEQLTVREWEEQVEVNDEDSAQLLEILLDVSISMGGDNINLAVALAAVILQAHFDDDSQYLYRQFALDMGQSTYVQTPREKKSLLKSLHKFDMNIGNGGTDILGAVRRAAMDVRQRAQQGQTPEVLLITDGADEISVEDLALVLGRDVILHTVTINGGNESLRRHSSTYYELYWGERGRWDMPQSDDYRVIGTDGRSHTEQPLGH